MTAPNDRAPSPEDDVALAGWKAMSERVAGDGYRMSDEYFTKLMAKLEHEIHDRHASVRHWMHAFLVSAARRKPELAEMALATADRIGEFTMDPGGEVHAAESIRKALGEPADD